MLLGLAMIDNIALFGARYFAAGLAIQLSFTYGSLLLLNSLARSQRLFFFFMCVLVLLFFPLSTDVDLPELHAICLGRLMLAGLGAAPASSTASESESLQESELLLQSSSSEKSASESESDSDDASTSYRFLF